MKTVRFTDVVERCGRPQVHALWTAPEQDREFQRALKAGRVMTVAPAAPGRAEVGHVGYERPPPPGAELLVFPKSLKRYAQARVVGIKFELVEQPTIVAAKPHEGWARRKHVRRKPAAARNAHAAEAMTQPTPAPVEEAPAASPPPRDRRHARPPARNGAVSAPSRHHSGTRRPPRESSRPRNITPLEALTTAARTALAALESGRAGDAYETLKRALE